jgi:hypothetical protein
MRANQIYKATKTSNPWVKNLQAILQNSEFSFVVHKDIIRKPYVNSNKQRVTDQFMQMQTYKVFINKHFFIRFWNMNL